MLPRDVVKACIAIYCEQGQWEGRAQRGLAGWRLPGYAVTAQATAAIQRTANDTILTVLAKFNTYLLTLFVLAHDLPNSGLLRLDKMVQQHYYAVAVELS